MWTWFLESPFAGKATELVYLTFLNTPVNFFILFNCVLKLQKYFWKTENQQVTLVKCLPILLALILMIFQEKEQI